MRLLPVLLCCLLVVALLPAGVSARTGDSLSYSNQETCTAVTHDSFRVDNTTVEELNETGTSTRTERNIQVTIEESETFIRVIASNPNGYCTEVSLQISDDVVTPAELGEISAVKPEGSNISAEWSAMHSLSEDELFTEVTFRLPPGASDVLFAPSKVRVQTLSWTGGAQRDADSALARVHEVLGTTPELEKRTYELDGEEGDTITVALTAADGREVEEWHAVYEKNGRWVPLNKESDSKVFYQNGDGVVKIHFNERADVEFTANPGIREKTRYEMRSYRSSLGDLMDVKLPWSDEE